MFVLGSISLAQACERGRAAQGKQHLRPPSTVLGYVRFILRELGHQNKVGGYARLLRDYDGI